MSFGLENLPKGWHRDTIIGKGITVEFVLKKISF